ncbi:ATP-binding protein [uncultured Dialister sp.]|uniref:ATP-binding protein n=1 Tax=uncultured Dialister sp. TaxID=278064 RepID=UPI00265A71E8|nr:ATP-binding protein [uncultured Dialister sp.]
MAKGDMVRITYVELWNFKNVRHGSINLLLQPEGFKSSVLGIFGQNGSGKTAFIDSLNILKQALSGRILDNQYAGYIMYGAECAVLSFHFIVSAGNIHYRVKYTFKLRKEAALPDSNVEAFSETEEDTVQYRPVIFDEELKCAVETESLKCPMTTVMNTKSNKAVFLPKAKYDLLIDDKTAYIQLMGDKWMALKLGKSFLFSSELLSFIRKNKNAEIYRLLLDSLARFGNFELFVMKTDMNGIISLSGLPFAFHLEGSAIGQTLLPINKPPVIPKDMFRVLSEMIGYMNIVLQTLIPGLTIGVHVLGTAFVGKTHMEGIRIGLTSCRNDREIPLVYESDGIKKIVSVLQLFIEIYNRPSMTVAVDELDSGIFEYLLGELLSIIQERGKGQLIFTSHNLRPLETLPTLCTAFTTTDPDERYIRIRNMKRSNNLRSSYYRNIILGNDNYTLYDETENYKIAAAFRKAGMQEEERRLNPKGGKPNA